MLAQANAMKVPNSKGTFKAINVEQMYQEERTQMEFEFEVMFAGRVAEECQQLWTRMQTEFDAMFHLLA